MITREAAVALLRIVAVSSISAMNVETPRDWQSPAPTRCGKGEGEGEDEGGCEGGCEGWV